MTTEKTLIVATLMSLAGLITAQSSLTTLAYIDSLKQKIVQQQTETNRIQTLTLLCTKYMYVDPDSAIHYGIKAVEKAEESGTEIERLFAMGILGEPYIYIGEMTKALELALDVLDDAENLNLEAIKEPVIGPSLYNLSEMYFQLGRYEESARYADKMGEF